MKCQVPQISWHGRDPVLSIDFQPIQSDVLRLASGGTDSHVLIWYITYQENKSVKIECAADLYRHNKSVNAVRFSPNGEFLASGDDEGAMFIWELKEQDQMNEPPKDDENIDKEYWYPVKLLRGHLDDIYDISWSKDGNLLASSSMDNTVIIWDMQRYTKVQIISDFKGYVQGVTLDPLNQFIASVGSDRTLRIHNMNSKKTVYRITKAPWTNSTEKGTFKARLFYDDTLQSYFRRLTFTPDGELLIVPSGILEKGEKITNTSYVFSRHALNKPVISLPTGDKYTVAVKCNPFLYKLRGGGDDTSNKENEPVKPMINLPHRMIFAVAASDSVLFYDTEQILPFAYVSNIHYTHLTDMSWSPDGLTLVASSTDGYCSFILFTREEMGEIYIPEKIKEPEKEIIPPADAVKTEKMDVSESATVTAVPAVDTKNATTPITPKKVKSPKPSPEAKDESVTPSSKASKNAADKKPVKKSPKMCSIKKFFISPKTVTQKQESHQEKPTQSSHIDKKEVAKITTIDITDSPLKGEEKTNVMPKQIAEKAEDVNNKVEAMDVDENPVKNITSDVGKDSSVSEKQSKCKVRLNFTDKNELAANIDDNASDSNPVSSVSAEDDAECQSKPSENENDWKLELSQDDEIVPMETATSENVVVDNQSAASSSGLSKKEVLPLAKTLPVVEKKTDKAPTPKGRRVSFITLSTKPTFKK